MDPQKIQPALAPAPSQKPKIFLILVVLATVIFLIIGYFGFKSLKTDITCGGFMGTLCPRGYFCWKPSKIADEVGQCVRNILVSNPAPLGETPSTPQTVSTVTPTPAEIVYQNDQLHFQLNYPESFQTVKGLGQSFLGEKPVVELGSSEAIISFSVKPNITKTKCEDLYNDRSLIDSDIGGELFRTFSNFSTINGITYENMIFRHLKNTICYEIVTSIAQTDAEKRKDFYTQFNQIEASFKFTYPEENPENWSLYSDKNGQYSIRYPSGYTLNENKAVSVDGVAVDMPGVIQIVSPAVN